MTDTAQEHRNIKSDKTAEKVEMTKRQKTKLQE